ncbi:MAG: quinolinate synthase NadA [Deltaproteobacteria bacterium]|nr:quinolinate synthase NadA [Deltaproteobacteria bacterium]
MKIESIAMSKKKGTPKGQVREAVLVPEHGVEGDAHAGSWHRQVSFLASESIEKARELGLDVGFGDFAENIATSGIDWMKIPVGARIRLGPDALVEVTQIGKECHTRCAIYYTAGDCIMPREGIFARVLKGGKISVGDEIRVLENASAEKLSAREKETMEKIRAIKDELGNELIILTHHYQRREIVELGDFKGDSLGLSQKAAADKSAKYIIFCGVHFMAESAAILAQDHQVVQIPDEEAGCWLADMVDICLVERAWDELTSILGPDALLPVVYMNSDADLKAFCGRHGGVVCTSSNAGDALRWGFSRREKVLFFPDQHLGRNSGNNLGMKPEEMIVWDPHEKLGGNSAEELRGAKLILWDGYCLVHTRFKVEHIEEMRERYPGAKIVVHPECTQEVVALADAVGSTSFIVKYVEKAPPGSTIVIGTEVNLVRRLAAEHPDKRIVELHKSLCPNMFKIDLDKLLWTLENLGKVNVVQVPADIKRDAKAALERMLDLAPKEKKGGGEQKVA